MRSLLLLLLPGLSVCQLLPDKFNFNPLLSVNGLRDVSHIPRSVNTTSKGAFLDSLVANLSVPELGMCVYFPFFKMLDKFYVFQLCPRCFRSKSGSVVWASASHYVSQFALLVINFISNLML